MQVVVVVSADGEWRALNNLLFPQDLDQTPFGKTFIQKFALGEKVWNVRFVQGGWGKIAAAASAQYIIDHYQPDLLINLGTCGGFAGLVENGVVLVVDRTIVYDIYELMGDPVEHLEKYTTRIDLSWLGEDPFLPGYQKGFLVSADRDLAVDQLSDLQQRFGAYAGDWESGAIAWTAARNQTRLLILRGVSDLVGADGDETYGNIALFESSAQTILRRLVDDLPEWLVRVGA